MPQLSTRSLSHVTHAAERDRHFLGAACTCTLGDGGSAASCRPWGRAAALQALVLEGILHQARVPLRLQGAIITVSVSTAAREQAGGGAEERAGQQGSQ